MIELCILPRTAADGPPPNRRPETQACAGRPRSREQQLPDENGTQTLRGAAATRDLLQVLTVTPHLGRWFSPAEDRPQLKYPKRESDPNPVILLRTVTPGYL